MREACLVTSLCLVSALAAIAGAREAEAACDITNPASGQTVTCDSNPPNPFTTSITAQLGSTNVTVNVLPGAILSTFARAIGVVNNSTVLNQGQVSTSGSNAFGISTTGDGSTLTNEGTITTIGSGSFGLDARGSNSTLINSGTINVSGADAAGIRSNETTGSTLIINSGTITATGSKGGSATSFPAGVLFQTGVDGTFVNQAGGIVSSATDSGVRGANGNITIQNAGTITGGNGIAINLGNGNDVIEVTGGQINGAIITGTGNDQFTMSGGTVTGDVNLGNGNNLLTMMGGQINGSIMLGTGTDTVTLFTGSTVTGSIDGGSGTNAFVLHGTGSGLFAGTIGNFQTLTKQNTGTWELTNSISGATAVVINGGTLILSGDNTYTGGTTISAGTLQLGNGGASGSIVGNITNNGVLAFNRSDTFTFPGVISGAGSVSQIGPGTTILTADNTYAGGTIIAAGTLQLGNGGASGSITGDVTNNATFAINRSDIFTFGGTISGTGAFQQNGTGTTILTGSNTYTGGTTISAGTLQLGNGGTSGSIVGDVANNGIFAINRSDTFTYGGVISGTGVLQQIGAGTTILTGSNTYTGGTTISAGTLQLGNGGTSGSILGNVANSGIFAINRSDTFTYGGVISGTGALQQIGTGTTILTGSNTYTGGTTISAGALIVNGSIASSSLTTVNSGASLLGTGTVGTTIVQAGGFLAPGNSPGTMTVAGSLAFQSGAFYVVQVNPTTASATNVSSTASLAGTVAASFAPGNYLARSYTILTAAGAVTGTFDALATLGLPPNFQTSLSYTGNTVLLNLRARLVPEPTPPPTPTAPPPPVPGLPPLPEPQLLPPLSSFTANQLNVGHAIDNFFNNGGALPPTFLPLFGLTGNNLTNALDRLSGEPATGAQRVAFQLTDQFLNVMLDPFVDGRSGVGRADHPALGFAPERELLPEDIALAYAKVLKAPPKPASFEQRWTVWGGAYGGSNRTTGDLAIIGSHDLSARTVGGAAGLDYRLMPDTVVGFALAGGGTDWSLSQGLGGGKSDAFQAGVYGATRAGPAYLAAAFAFTNHWMSTDRLAVSDHLTADFKAQSYGGRLEGGYRFGTPYGGITPYAAIQAQSFHTPGYTETDAIANGFALAFASRDATDTRSELGTRFDRVLAVYSNAVLALRGRVAWAHDWVSDPTLMPAFQALPGASFIVNGATPAKNSALTSAGAELRLANGVTLLAKFDGEFASHSSTYAGTGTLRYRW